MPEEGGATYAPEPIDTSRVRLDAKLLALCERLAKNNHEVWARQRIREGWRYGPARDDARKEHPSLVSYEELPESEKEYDRNTVLETLKATVALGYRIVATAKPGRRGRAKRARHRRAPVASEETVAALAAGVNDMSDTPEELNSYAPPLRSALALMEEKCGAPFSESDAAAIKQQRRHRWIVVAFCLFGTFAVIFSILDVTRLLPLERHESLTKWLALGLFAGEVVTVLGALIAALVGWRFALQGNWLEERHRAERLRLLKFRMLLDPSLVGGGAVGGGTGGGLAAWQSKLAAEFNAVERIEESTLHEWIEETRAPDMAMCPPQGAFNERLLRDVVAYYRRKRLDPQASYFYRQAASNLRRDWSTRLIPPLLFFASVFFALIHLITEAFEMGRELLEHRGLNGYAEAWLHGRNAWGVALVFLAAALPTFGAGLRGLRAAYEFSRNTVRFRALHFALELLRERVSREDAKPEEVWRDLWWCEWLLEAEHREWLRLMIEAEWIG